MVLQKKNWEGTLKFMKSHELEKWKNNVLQKEDDFHEKISKITEDKPSQNTRKRRELGNTRNSDAILLPRVQDSEYLKLIVNVGAFAFKVNIEVVETYSQCLRNQLDLKEITLPDDEVSPLAFAGIYEWMLAENPSLPRKGIIELYKAAEFLGIPEFLEQCWKCLSNPLLNEDKAFVIYLEALAFDVPEIRKTMLNRISRFFLPIVSVVEFLHMPLEDLKILLRSSLTAVNSELEIFYACARYLNFDWEERQHSLLSVMELIRYDFLPVKFVMTLVEQTSQSLTQEVAQVVGHPEIQQKLRDLLHYHCFAALPGPKTVSIQKSLDRNWIYDSRCAYHSRDVTPNKASSSVIPYVEFLAYLKFLCGSKSKYWESFEHIKYTCNSTGPESTVKCEVI